MVKPAPIDAPERHYGISEIARPEIAHPETPRPETPRDKLRAAAFSGETLTLKQAVGLALLFHPDLDVFEADVRVADADRIAAAIYPNPSLELEGEEFGALIAGDTQLTFWVRQALILSHRRALGRDAARAHTEAARLAYLGGKLEVTLKVQRAFVETVGAAARVELVTQLLDDARELVRAVEIRVQAEDVPELELLRAQVELEHANVEVQAARLDLERARATLVATMGLVEGSPPPCEDLPDEMPTLPPLSDLEAKLLKSHPAIRAARAEIRGFKLDQRRAEAQAIPDLEAGVGVHRGLADGANLWSFGLGIPLPVFDTNQGERARLAAITSRTRAELQSIVTSRLLALRSAHTSFNAARTSWVLNRTRVLPLAEQAYQRTSEAYRLGQSNYLAVVDARRGVNEARIDTLDAQTRSHLALFEVWASMGVVGGATGGRP